MPEFELQKVFEEQGKNELKNFIYERIKYDYAKYEELMQHPDDNDYYDIALYTLQSIFRTLKKAGIKFD